MNESEFREIVNNYLIPMFPGAWIDDHRFAPTVNISQRLAVQYQDGPTSMAIKPSVNSTYRLVVRRRQQFERSEVQMSHAFLSKLQGIDAFLQKGLKEDVLRSITRRAISESIRLGFESISELVIRQFEDWAEQTYEGSRISATVGIIHPAANNDAPEYAELCSEDFGRVLTNGLDTIITLDGHGKVRDHIELQQIIPEVEFAPQRYLAIASWTLDATSSHAITLNRNGEILIFSQGILRFAKRRGRWLHFTHQPILRQLQNGPGRTWAEDLRREVYHSCLDVSFARTGACIGLVKQQSLAACLDIIDANDILATSDSVKARAMRAFIGTRFQELPRVIRQELLAIDGAMVLDYEGNLVAVGAIIKVSAGSTGGARRKAAQTLGEFGVGIKVSEDGAVTCFGEEESPAVSFA